MPASALPSFRPSCHPSQLHSSYLHRVDAPTPAWCHLSSTPLSKAGTTSLIPWVLQTVKGITVFLCQVLSPLIGGTYCLNQGEHGRIQNSPSLTARWRVASLAFPPISSGVRH